MGLESSLPPNEAVHAFIGQVVERALENRQGDVISRVNAVGVSHGFQFGTGVAVDLVEIEAFFHRAIALARSIDTASTRRSPNEIVRLLLSVTLGIRVLAQARPERSLLEGVARPALAYFDLIMAPR